MVGGAIIVAWIAGLAVLVRREYFRPQVERLAEAAKRVAPGVVYYGVMQGERQVGFASSIIDTTGASITVRDYFAADLPVGGQARRASGRMNVTLSRALRMTDFDLELNTEGAPLHATGHVEHDSVLVLAIGSGSAKPDTQRVSLTGPVLLPTIVPLALALSEPPKVGKHYVLPVFNPASMASADMGFDVQAESSFVVSDSAAYDSTAARWKGIRPATLRAWQVSGKSTAGFSGWIDEQGRIVQTTLLGFELRRLPYELAFENWRATSGRDAVTRDRDILEMTAIAANKRMTSHVGVLRVRLTGVDLTGFDLNGQRQRLTGDTLTVTSEPERALSTSLTLPMSGRDPQNTRPEPLLESRDPKIISLARQLAGTERNPRVVAERINTWVHDSLRKRITFGVPNALQVLQSRTGDCNEHTQLFVALARAAGLPARIAAGLAYVDGKFFYHAWPEVLFDDWVAVDPTFGQFPADAAHLRFVIGGVARQTELLRLMGNLKIDVLAASDAPRSSTTRK
jgi:hypothetical protein